MNRIFVSTIFFACCVPLLSCSSVPSFQDTAVGTKAGGTPVLPADIVEVIRCELREVVQAHPELKEYIVAAALTLRVDDNAGLLPSLSFIDPYKISGTNFTFGINAQLSGTRQRIFTQTVQFDMREVASHPACISPSQGQAGFQVNGVNLLGNLGLEEIAGMGLSVKEQNGVKFLDPAQPAGASNALKYPPFGSTVQFTLTKSLGVGPTWTLTHFKGPSGTTGSSGGTSVGGAPGLVSGARTDTHLLLITFGPPKKQGRAPFALTEEQLKRDAGETAQTILFDLRLQLLQGSIQ
jgi:hypothetical protein